MRDRETAERPEGPRDLEMRNHDHHAEQKRDRVEINGLKSFLETQRAKRDHRGAAEEGDARTIEPQARNAADGDADIGQRQDDERDHAFEVHSPAAAPSIARGRSSWLAACSSRVSGMKAKKTRNATAAAAPSARKETL